MFGSDVALAVAAYNAGENNVIKYGHKVPPFAETRDYVAKVLAYYNRYN
jgi:soluble lytic murein transglycosylase-like protein